MEPQSNQTTSALPTGTVTFLFTDVEGSTRLWEQAPSAMRPALVRHDALAEGLIGTCAGVLVKSRGEGDSLFAVFTHATDAVHAACALQQAFIGEAWPDEAPLRVRMALHTGETDERDRDYYGQAVNRCARLRTVAAGRQVLVSATTHALVHTTLPEGAWLREIGEMRLRHLRKMEIVYELLHPSLPDESPPAQNWATLRTNSVRYARGLIQSRPDLRSLAGALRQAGQQAQQSFTQNDLLQALREANRAGWEQARQAAQRSAASDVVPPE